MPDADSDTEIELDALALQLPAPGMQIPSLQLPLLREIILSTCCKKSCLERLSLEQLFKWRSEIPKDRACRDGYFMGYLAHYISSRKLTFPGVEGNISYPLHDAFS